MIRIGISALLQISRSPTTVLPPETGPGAASERMRRLHGSAQAVDRRQQVSPQGLLEEKAIGAAVLCRLAIGVFGVHSHNNDLGLGSLLLDLPQGLQAVDSRQGEV